MRIDYDHRIQNLTNEKEEEKRKSTRIIENLKSEIKEQEVVVSRMRDEFNNDLKGKEDHIISLERQVEE